MRKNTSSVQKSPIEEATTDQNSQPKKRAADKKPSQSRTKRMKTAKADSPSKKGASRSRAAKDTPIVNSQEAELPQASSPGRKDVSNRPMTETDEFNRRLAECYDELKWLYMELYGDMAQLDSLIHNVREIHTVRPKELKALDNTPNLDGLLDSPQLWMQLDPGRFASTLTGLQSRLPYLQELGINGLLLHSLLKTCPAREVCDFRAVRPALGEIGQLPALAGRCRELGIRLGLALDVNHTSSEQVWAVRAKNGEWEYGGYYTRMEGSRWDLNWRNPAVFNEMTYHLLFLANCGVAWLQLTAPPLPNVARMLRILLHLVCPAVLLTGAGEDAYLGTEEKPEFALNEEETLPAALWSSFAAQDARLLKACLNRPKEGREFFRLRGERAQRWPLPEQELCEMGFDPAMHRAFLQEFFTGAYPASFARGVALEDGVCGTTASFCGMEKALYEGDAAGITLALDRIALAHALLLAAPGAPVLQSGDEIGQLNDYSFWDDPRRAWDILSLLRARFSWESVETPGGAAGRLHERLQRLFAVRAQHPVFSAHAFCEALDSGDRAVLYLRRDFHNERLTALYNFSGQEREVNLPEGAYRNLLTGAPSAGGMTALAPYGFLWLLEKSHEKGSADHL